MYKSLVFGDTQYIQGRVRTQSPTTINYAGEIPTFGNFQGSEMPCSITFVHKIKSLCLNKSCSKFEVDMKKLRFL